MLSTLEHLPDGLLDASARNLYGVLTGPTLIHLRGRRPEPLLVCVLLHGNEDTGFEAVRQVLVQYRQQELPRALSLFIGNVEAAARNLRRLDHQPDYNRVWPGALTDGRAEHAMMREVVEQMQARRVFASIDIHNNTGVNPLYACLNVLAPEFLHLGTLFSRTIVYFLSPLGVQSLAFAKLCPSVTVECGKAGLSANEKHAAALIDAALHLDRFPESFPAARDFDLYHTVATVTVPPEVSFTFGPGPADICFDPQIEHLNFRDLQVGTRLADLRTRRLEPLEAWGEDGSLVSARYFERHGNELRLKCDATPAMLTVDEQAIRQDCLCYLMERIESPDRPEPGSGTMPLPHA